VLAWLEDAHHLSASHDSAHRNDSAAESFAQNEHVRHDFFVLALNSGAGATQARLDFIRNHQDVFGFRDRSDFFQIPLRRNNDPGFTLDGLQQYRHRVGINFFFQCLGIAVGNTHKTWSKGSKVFTGALIGRKTHNGNRAPVEVFFCHDNFCFVRRNTLNPVSPSPCNLHGTFYRLSTSIHRQDHVHPQQCCQLLGERPQLVVRKSPGCESHFPQLLLCRPDEGSIAVPKIDRGVGGEAI